MIEKYKKAECVDKLWGTLSYRAKNAIRDMDVFSDENVPNKIRELGIEEEVTPAMMASIVNEHGSNYLLEQDNFGPVIVEEILEYLETLKLLK